MDQELIFKIVNIAAVISIGAVLGSFLNMLIYRLHRNQNLLGHSYCDYTKQQLGSRDLIPVISFIIFRGRCRHCHKPLPIAYPVIELFTAIIALIVFVRITGADPLGTFLNLQYLVVLFMAISLEFFALYDLYYWEIDLRSVTACISVLLLLNGVALFMPLPFIGNPASNLLAAILAGAFTWLLMVISQGKGLGSGDILLYFFSGLILGFDGIFLAFIITVVTGSLVGVLLIAREHRMRGLIIQFAPFISFGTLLVLLFRDEINMLFMQLFHLTPL